MDSAPAGATRLGNRSSTRHGGPAQVFVGPVRKWRKVLSPVSGASPSPSAARTSLLKWMPVPSATTNGGAKEDSPMTDEMLARQVRPVKYVPIAVVLQRSREEAAIEEAENIEAEAAGTVEPAEAAETAGATEETNEAVPMETVDENVESRAAEAVDTTDAAESTGAGGSTEGTVATATGISKATETEDTSEATGGNEATKASEPSVTEGDISKQSDPSPGDTRIAVTS